MCVRYNKPPNATYNPTNIDGLTLIAIIIYNDGILICQMMINKERTKELHNNQLISKDRVFTKFQNHQIHAKQKNIRITKLKTSDQKNPLFPFRRGDQ